MFYTEELIYNKSISSFFNVYEPRDYKIVLGRSRTIENDVIEEKCKEDKILIVKRFTGGGTVLFSTGMLIWTIIIPTQRICLNQTIWFEIFSKWIIEILSCFDIKNLLAQGVSDITLNDRKICGTSLYIGSQKVLYHGTLLIDLDLSLLDKYLKMPDKMPQYRMKRMHGDFVTTLKNSGYDISKNKLISKFNESFKPTEEKYWQRKN